MLINEMSAEVKKAYYFLKEYCRENCVNDICDLFDRKTLVENVSQSDWDWSVKDEMGCCNLSEDEARKRTEEWLLSMSNEILFYDRICDYCQYSLILDKAEDLGYTEE